MGGFASYGIWHYYWEHIDEYFNVFNRCEQSQKKGDPYPNTPFVEFFLNGMLSTINRLHDKANQIIANVLFTYNLDHLLRDKKINKRQHAILMQLHELGEQIRKSDLNHFSWYNALYSRLSKQTKMRDWRELEERKLIDIGQAGKIILHFIKPDIQLVDHPDTRIEK